MKKKDHYAEVAALAVVVHEVLDDLARLGRTVPEHAKAALTAVEAWLQGAPIDSAALQAAADLSFQEGVPFAQREKDRALSWVRTAAGNLAWLARKQRGWETADASVLDAAEYALSSLGVAGVKDRTQLRAQHAAALAATAQAPAKAAPSQPEPKDRGKSTNLAAFIGKKANANLATRGPVFDQAARGTAQQLRDLLKQRHFEAHPAVIAFDKRYGGLVMADSPGEEGYDWLFGAHACLQSDAHVDPRCEKPDWVPVAYSPNDCIYYLDKKGVAWVIDTIEDSKPSRFAKDGDAMVRRILGDD